MKRVDMLLASQKDCGLTKYSNVSCLLFLYASSDNQLFFNVITDPFWLQHIADLYENDFAFSYNLNGLFDSLQIPNPDVVADEPLPANLGLRMVALQQTGFFNVQQNRNAFSMLDALRVISETKGYYAPPNLIIPKKVSPDISPDRPGPRGHNRDDGDGVGGAGFAN